MVFLGLNMPPRFSMYNSPDKTIANAAEAS
jgi:hypothetical protein